MNGGPLTTELRVQAILSKWLPHYVVRQARRYAAEGAFGLTPQAMEDMLTGYVFPFRPRGIVATSTFQEWPVDALPHVQVMSPSWQKVGGDERGDHISYEIRVADVVGAQEAEDTRLLRACYEDAIPELLRQHQSLEGYAAGIDVIGGGPAELSEIDGEDARTFQGSVTVCQVLVHGVIDPKAGPGLLDPLPDEDGVPPVQPAAPTVETVSLEYPDGRTTETVAGDFVDG